MPAKPLKKEQYIPTIRNVSSSNRNSYQPKYSSIEDYLNKLWYVRNGKYPAQKRIKIISINYYCEIS